MKNIVRASEITAVEASEVKAQVTELISGNGYAVVEDRAGAEAYLAEFDGEIAEEQVQSFSFDGELDEEMDYQYTITVTITGYYKDSGSDDYCYSVRVDED